MHRDKQPFSASCSCPPDSPLAGHGCAALAGEVSNKQHRSGQVLQAGQGQALHCVAVLFRTIQQARGVCTAKGSFGHVSRQS